VSIRVYAFENKPLQDTYYVNLIRALASQGFIITNADVVVVFSSIIFVAAPGSDSILTMSGFKLLTLVVSNGDNTGVFASINQELIGQIDRSRSDGT
jgi:hypothetical protein